MRSVDIQAPAKIRMAAISFGALYRRALFGIKLLRNPGRSKLSYLINGLIFGQVGICGNRLAEELEKKIEALN